VDAQTLFAPLGPTYDRYASLLSFGQDPRWRRFLVSRVEAGSGDRVLDVATGTGAVALELVRQKGCSVVGVDQSEGMLDTARRRVNGSVELVHGSAEALPFGDGEFDVVASAVGAIFAPDHRAVAGELLRVCRPGGTIGMINFTPEGLAADFFSVFGGPTPPPPVRWGSEEHVHELLGDGVETLDMSRHVLVERHPGGPEGYAGFYKRTFGPIVAAYAAADDPAALDAAFLDFARRANRAQSGAEYRYEYLLVVARRSG
jgi:ubiquinone/menaquinone biosynthesis C-methylase UbiE